MKLRKCIILERNSLFFSKNFWKISGQNVTLSQTRPLEAVGLKTDYLHLVHLNFKPISKTEKHLT